MKSIGRPGPTVSLEEARAQLFATMHRIEPRRLPVDRSLGRVLARAVVAAGRNSRLPLLPALANVGQGGNLFPQACEAGLSPP